MKTFHLEVITPDASVFEGEIAHLRVPAHGGNLGVLANHAPLLTPLEIGDAILRMPDDSKEYLMIAEGFLEVENNRVRILADVSERAETIDVERAERAEERARKRLKERTDPEFDESRAVAALERAAARVRIAKELLRRRG